MNILEAYDNSLKREGHVRDPDQAELLNILHDLQLELETAALPRRGLGSFLRRRINNEYQGIKGAYIWGGVGRGKTFIMDLFFETLGIEAKRRSHFHRMMHSVHEQLRELGDVTDPLDKVAADIAENTRVLCFDEFFVSDIGDAMILARLLDGLFKRGVTLIATSNSPPDELYKDGLQRSRFIPAIELLKSYTRIIELGGRTDYRLRLLQQAGTYLTPNDRDAEGKLVRIFEESASSDIMHDRQLDVYGREIRARCCAKGIAWFDFADLCDGPRSQSDYIEIARWYPTVIVSDVPVFDEKTEDQARRFIALVDEFYDRRVKLIVSAEADANALYGGKQLAFEFDRTTSRLIEMQSNAFLALPHLA